MDIMWIPAILIAMFSLVLTLLFGYWKTGYTLALLVLVLAGVAFGWWVHGGLTNHQAMNYYYSGEANGYNRGYRDSNTQWLGRTDNLTITYDIQRSHLFDMRNFD